MKGAANAMKLVRFLYNGREQYGDLQADTIRLLDGALDTGFTPSDKCAARADVRLLAPVRPSKAVCIGLNYMDHIIESHEKVPTSPVVFIKPSTAVIGPGGRIVYPAQSKRVDYEGELAIVIGRRAKNVPEHEAASHILGYTCANDVTARDLQPSDGQWSVAKGLDTFLPLGPCVDTEADPSGLPIRTILNGRTVQNSNTRHLLFKPLWIVSWLSAVMTLLPGDVILTGTTLGIGPMQPGDTVSVEIDGIGRLENTIVSDGAKGETDV